MYNFCLPHLNDGFRNSARRGSNISATARRVRLFISYEHPIIYSHQTFIGFRPKNPYTQSSTEIKIPQKRKNTHKESRRSEKKKNPRDKIKPHSLVLAFEPPLPRRPVSIKQSLLSWASIRVPLPPFLALSARIYIYNP